MKHTKILKIAVVASLALTATMPVLTESATMQANAVSKKQATAKKLLKLATKKGESVSAIASELKSEISKGNLNKIRKTQVKLKKSIISYSKYLKKQRLSQKNKESLKRKYVDSNQKIVKNIQTEITLANTIDSAMQEIGKLTYDESQNRIKELSNKVSIINETRIQNGQTEIPESLQSAFNAKIKLLENQAKINENKEVDLLKIQSTEYEKASNALKKAMDDANLKLIQSTYKTFNTKALNYQKLINDDKKISSNTRGILKKQYIYPAIILQAQIVKEKDIYTQILNAISYIKGYQYANAQTTLNKINQAIENGKANRLQKNAPDLPEKLKNEMNNTTINLQNYIYGKNVPLNYINYSYQNVIGKLNGFVTIGSNAFIGIPLAYETNGKVYQKKFNQVKVTITIDKTGADNISKTGKYNKTLYFKGAGNTKIYELQPIIESKTVSSVLPDKFDVDTNYYIEFPNIDGVTYSNVTFSN